MATFVASVDSQPASGRVETSARRKEPGFAVLLVSCLTLFALAVHGYHPYAEDGGLYMAGVKRLLDPALYPQGAAFVLEPMRYSRFAPMVAWIVRLAPMGLPVVLLALHLLSVWVTLFASWMLAERCWPTRSARAGAVTLLACWLSLPVAGTALVLMDPYLTARSLSTPCMVLALVGVLDLTEQHDTSAVQSSRWRGLCLWLGGTTLAALMHPLMTTYALGATLMLACVRSSSPSIRVWGAATLSALALAMATILHLFAKPESAAYLRVALTRTYWYPATWSWYELAGLAAPLAILAVIALRNSPGPIQHESVQLSPVQHELGWMTVLVGAAAWLIALLFARAGNQTHLVARLQPLRAFQIVYLIMVLALGAKLGEFVLRRSAWRWAVAIVLLGGVMLGAERSSFPDSNHMELPWTSPRNPWVQAFLWIRENTPVDALFALDADYINASGEDAQCFRSIAERSSLPDYSKDGGEASIAPDLTEAWGLGQQAQQALSAPSTSDAQRIAALRPLGVSWIVLESRAVTEFNCPYANADVKVCRLR